MSIDVAHGSEYNSLPRHTHGWVVAYGIVSIIVGILAFAAPLMATFTTVVAIGALLLVGGAASLGVALFGGEHEGRLYAGLFGALSLLIGAIMAFEPVSGAVSLTMLLGIWLGGRGFMEIVFGTKLRNGRGLMIAIGVLNILFAIIVLAALPASALTLPGYLMAVSFLCGGANALVAASYLRKNPA